MHSPARLGANAPFVFLAVLPLLQPAWAQPVFEALVVPALGGAANGGASAAAATPDGRRIVFESGASNLVVGDTNGADDIFLRDRSLGITMRVSVGSMRWDGEQDQANGRSFSPVISADGRVVAFASEASNLGHQDTNGVADVFVHVLSTGMTARVSLPNGGGQSAGGIPWMQPIALSADGRFVAFVSEASDLVAGDTNGAADVFVHDRSTGETRRVSVSSAAVEGNGASIWPSVSADGRYGAFASVASNLVDGDTNGARDVFVHDLTLHRTSRVSEATGAVQGNGNSDRPVITGDGRYVAFVSNASTFEAGDGAETDVFVHNLASGVTERVRARDALVRLPGPYPRDWLSGSFVMSEDARFFAFVAPYYPYDAHNSYFYDRALDVCRRIGETASGASADRSVQPYAISADGRTVIIGTNAHNLIAGYSGGLLAWTRPADADDDGMPDDWEQRFGLDAASAGDALLDGDGDGVANREEYVAGTHPCGTVVQYLAEGSTRWSFRTDVAIANPSSLAPARVLLTIHRSTMGHEDLRLFRYVYIERSDRVIVDVAAVEGMLDGCDSARLCDPGQDFSLTLESDAEIAVERVMRWGEGGYGMHGERAVEASSQWFFAEGATHSGFALYYLLFNPTATETDVTIALFTPAGRMMNGATPVELSALLPPFSRGTVPIPADWWIAESDVATVVRSSTGVPFVAERAMYLSRPDQAFAAGHASAGVPAPRATWYFAEGATMGLFDAYLLLFNPGLREATVDVTMLLDEGPPVSTAIVVPSETRRTLWLNGVDPRLEGRSFGLVVRARGGEPIVAERAMWWPRGGPHAWWEAHAVSGMAAPARSWAFADAEVGGADQARTYVLLANPSTSPAFVEVIARSGTVAPSRTMTLAPLSRATVDLSTFCPPLRYSVTVESSVPIVAERATYASANGVPWAAGLALGGTPRQ